MKPTPTMACLGLDWSNPEEPVFRLAVVGSNENEELRPIAGTLSFRVTDSAQRYCCGWFDLTGAEPRHVTCQEWTKIRSGKQCPRCRYKEGFIVAHQSHRSGSALPENVSTYLKQPHWLYLDIFGDGAMKVGTVAEARLPSRLPEQGAVAAAYVAQTANGVDIRQVESAVSERFGLSQGVSTKRKLQSLQTRIDQPALRRELDTLLREVQSYLRGPVLDDALVTVPDEPAHWLPPACAEAAFAATPVEAYPASLTTGDHSMRIVGVTGPIAVVSVEDGEEDTRYVVDLGALVGRELTFGNFASSLPPTQSSLF